MRVLRRVSVTGEVLRRRRDAHALAAAYPRCRELGDALRVVAERARADHRIARVGVHVADRSVIHQDAVGEQTLTDGARRALRVRGVAGRADRHRARERRAIADADDGAAFLVDPDRHRRQAAAPRRVLDFAQHRADLRLRLDVAAEGEEQNDRRPRRLRIASSSGPGACGPSKPAHTSAPVPSFTRAAASVTRDRELSERSSALGPVRDALEDDPADLLRRRERSARCGGGFAVPRCDRRAHR